LHLCIYSTISRVTMPSCIITSHLWPLHLDSLYHTPTIWYYAPTYSENSLGRKRA
jgi:hypothetical protein